MDNIEWIRNPFADEMFFFLALRVLYVVVGSAALLLVFNLRKPSRLFKTNIWHKYVVWSVMGPAILVIVYAGYLPLLLLSTFIMYHATKEYLLLTKPGFFYSVLLWIANTVTLLVVALAHEHILVLPLGYALLAGIGAAMRNRLDEEVQKMFSFLFGTMWVGLPLALFAALYHEQGGRHGLVVIMGVVSFSDVFAVLLGKAAKVTGIGVAPLASRVSPNKTQGGLAGSVVGGIVAFLAYDGMAIFGWGLGLGLAAAMGLVAASGDLVESLLKRTAGVKDSGTLIPHHGGMLDRIDSMLPAVVVFWLVVKGMECLEGYVG